MREPTTTCTRNAATLPIHRAVMAAADKEALAGIVRPLTREEDALLDGFLDRLDNSDLSADIRTLFGETS